MSTTETDTIIETDPPRVVNVTRENGAELTKAAAADAATICGIFRGHDAKMNRVYETLKARLTGRTEAEALYYVPKLKTALKAAGFNPGTLGRIFASVVWAVETGQPLGTWATYSGKTGLDAVYAAHRKAQAQASRSGGRKRSTTAETPEPVAPADPVEAAIATLFALNLDDLSTVALWVEQRMNVLQNAAEEAESADEAADASDDVAEAFAAPAPARRRRHNAALAA